MSYILCIKVTYGMYLKLKKKNIEGGVFWLVSLIRLTRRIKKLCAQRSDFFQRKTGKHLTFFQPFILVFKTIWVQKIR